MNYKCKLCGKVIWRDSNKRWIKSVCEQTGKETRIYRISEQALKEKNT